MSFKNIFKFVRDVLGKSQNYNMADGAREITKAAREVFGEPSTGATDGTGPKNIRLMCWSHVFRNFTPMLKSLPKDLAAKIIQAIEDLQWSVLNENSFRLVYDLLEQQFKDENKDNPEVSVQLSIFFSYFKKQWIDSPVFRWYEFSHPWHLSNNQGIEGVNKSIKENHTFKGEVRSK